MPKKLLVNLDSKPTSEDILYLFNIINSMSYDDAVKAVNLIKDNVDLLNFLKTNSQYPSIKILCLNKLENLNVIC